VPGDAQQPTEVPETVAEGAAPAASSDAALEEAQEHATDTVMGWLALYLPSYGTSVVLHLAVGLLAWFVSWQVQAQAAPLPYVYRSALVNEPKVNVEKKTEKKTEKKVRKDELKSKRGPADKAGTGRGHNRPGPTSILREFTTNPIPDVASNGYERLEVIGVGGGGKEIGGFEGLGSGRGFFGVGGGGDEGEAAEARKIVYIVDRSGSMTDSMDFVKYELKRSIGELDEAHEFHVIFYSSGPPVEMPTRRLVNATERNKQLAFEFVDSIIPQGETDPSKALERAFSGNPDLIYLLTDGEFDKGIIDLVKRLNVGAKVTVHTIGFLYSTGEAVLKQIAKENGGNYKFVSDQDLATLSQ
jgi:hypothetical protein